MIKFKLKNKGTVNQWFGGAPDRYAAIGVGGHPGIDTSNGFDSPVPCDNAGLVYKTVTPETSSEGYQGIWMIVESGTDVVEVAYGHLNRLLVKDDAIITEGTIVGTQGNKGFVFFGGTRITPDMQAAGDTRGNHLHTQYRPVRKVKKITKGMHYLNLLSGKRYKDENGYYYEIVNYDNGFNGCVNPMNYHTEDAATGTKVAIQQTLIATLQKVVAIYQSLLTKK